MGQRLSRNSQNSQSFEKFLIFLIIVLNAYAVFAFGLTTDFGKSAFTMGLAITSGLWLGGLVMRKQVPAIRPVAFFVSAFLLLYGWIAVVNAGFVHDWTNGFSPVEGAPGIGWLPSSLNQDRSREDMLRLTAFIIGAWMVADLSRNRFQRRWLLQSIVLTGLVFALIGIFQKAANAEQMLFFDKAIEGKTFFASFRYHGNATTFLNLCWPVAGALLLSTYLKQEASIMLSVWACAFVFLFASLFINTSRMGHVLGPLMLVFFALIYFRPITKLLKASPLPVWSQLVSLLLLAGAAGTLAAINVTDSLERWDNVNESMGARMATYRTTLSMVGPAGPWGMGPGTFSTAFPYYVTAEKRELNTFFHTAHQDYLQGLVEWGWVGFGLWMFLFGWIICVAVRRAMQRSFYMGAHLVALFSMAIHATFDFPVQIASLQWFALMYGAMIATAERQRNSHRRHC